jgi:carbon monoxide dehydrogenase subunit G
MELEHSFTVPVTKERAWDVLLDVEKVAPCMPGATVDSFDGKVINGRMKVKLGPISMTYAGKAEIVEQDAQAGLIRMEASGKETKGAGTASASVRSVLEAQGPQTRVTVHTTMNVTGKPAQFGRGVMNEVSGKLIGIFADNLADLLSQNEDAGAGEGAGGDAPAGDVAAGDVAAGPVAAGNGAAAATAAPAALTPVSDLHLNARAAAALHREGLITAGDVAGKTAKELLAIDGIGRASVDEIKSSLAEHGIALASADSVTAETTETTGAAETAGTAGASGVAEAGGTAGAAGASGGADGGVADAGRGEVGATPSAAGSAGGASKAAASTTASSTAPTTSSPNGQSAKAGTAGSAGSAVAPPRRRQRDESLNLLRVAGGPVLKRSIPVLAGLTAVIIIGIRRRLHRRSS